MEILILILSIIILVINIILIFRFRDKGTQKQIEQLQQHLSRLEKNMLDEIRYSRECETARSGQNREELSRNLSDFRTEHRDVLKNLSDQNTQVIHSFQKNFSEHMEFFQHLLKEKMEELTIRQQNLVQSTEKKLEDMRQTVEEKLQKTLHERLGQSFELVSRQLEHVQKGLGEMQTLAHDVGGLKRVLSNVKMRGSIGEIQLEMLLEQLLAPEQYTANVKTKRNSDAIVEFAIRLPGKEDSRENVFLPVDAKFPKDAYEQLLDAYESADPQRIDVASKNIEQTIRNMAKDIHDKYLDPPHTTDFGIMFLPFESIYSEVVRRASLLEQLQRNYQVIVTGPTTFAAILNSLQMGFRTLAIQKRSSEVWRILGNVKNEFDKFGGMLEKAQKSIQTANNQLEEVIGKRTRAIQRQLRSVEVFPSDESQIQLTIDNPDYQENEQ
ncbi:DNA recombination protein RmuC [Sanguibacteroides justesenii]|uniref:Recombinase RmuC n=1 Tax=Sanguibacteroides justesenii TaxID=1547597 RepID=A0A0C3R1Y8_9PORP|nr:DNA recombination protein RmuC [Sanguibacteroides justesenii]KIO42820.1 recombinase RmuC [Sanguibacteroides justesenii]PXZ44139.1 DNA recombination protein RmuC [Sanguibacteroides justesenii]